MLLNGLMQLASLGCTFYNSTCNKSDNQLANIAHCSDTKIHFRSVDIYASYLVLEKKPFSTIIKEAIRPAAIELITMDSFAKFNIDSSSKAKPAINIAIV